MNQATEIQEIVVILGRLQHRSRVWMHNYRPLESPAIIISQRHLCTALDDDIIHLSLQLEEDGMLRLRPVGSDT